MRLLSTIRLSVLTDSADSKIPPKSLFISQCYGTALGATVNLLLIRSVIDSKRSFLDGTEIDPSGQWTGRKPAIFFSASAIFGLVGKSFRHLLSSSDLLS